MNPLGAALLASLAFLFQATSVVGWPFGEAVSTEDPLYHQLAEWKSSLKKRYDASKTKTVRITDWVEIKSEAIDRFFPVYRFFAIGWDESRAPDVHDDAIVVCAGSLSVTLAFKSEGETKNHAFYGGPYRPFESFLRLNKVKVKSDKDVQDLWRAFCDVHRNRWHDNPMSRTSEASWELGIQVNSGVRYWKAVGIDDKGQVVSFVAKYRNEEGEQDGAEQPATAPKSKPKGEKKAKPESEGRSQ